MLSLIKPEKATPSLSSHVDNVLVANASFPCTAMLLYNSTLLAVASSRTGAVLINVANSTNAFFVKELSISSSNLLCLEKISNFGFTFS